jgi:hypothetical protein
MDLGYVFDVADLATSQGNAPCQPQGVKGL